MKFDKSKYKAVVGSGVTSTSTDEDGRSEFPLIATDDIAYDDNTRLDEALEKLSQTQVDVNAFKAHVYGEDGSVSRIAFETGGDLAFKIQYHSLTQSEYDLQERGSIETWDGADKEVFVPELTFAKIGSRGDIFKEILSYFRFSLILQYHENEDFFLKVYCDEAKFSYYDDNKEKKVISLTFHFWHNYVCNEIEFGVALHEYGDYFKLAYESNENPVTIKAAPFITTSGGQRIAGNLTMNSAKVETLLEGNTITAADKVIATAFYEP